MHWRFPQPAEEELRAPVEKAIDAWWKAFERRTEDLDALFSGKKKWDLPRWMNENLQQISPELMWEFGPGFSGGHRLVITPEATRHLRPLVKVVLERGPTIKGWDFVTYRQREAIDVVAQTVEGRAEADLAALTAVAAAGKCGFVDLTFFVKEKPKDFEHAALVAAEGLLGEEFLDHWIGVISVEEGKGEPLDALPAAVDALIEKRRAALPATPWYLRSNSASWSLAKINPPDADDYADQDDLVIAKTSDLERLENTARGRPFSSRRFSRCGETFCTLKTDGSQGLPEDGFPDKSSIEDAVDEVLVPRKLGCYVGGGTGKRYSYVDLALTEVDQAIPLLVGAMRRGKLPKRSWIQFFEPELRDEWIPIWADTPPPPMAHAD